MGTRADFYLGRGKNAEWLGSVAWDGYPSGIVLTVGRHKYKDFPAGQHLFDARTEPEFRERLGQYFTNRSDVSLPDEHGWPWPWDDSQTTDYAYAFDDGLVYGSCFGSAWFDASQPEPEEHEDRKSAIFPDMTMRKNLTLGPRSGVIVITSEHPESAEDKAK